MASDLSLDEYVAREERYERTGKLDPAPSAAGPIPPPPVPGQLPSPPGTSGFGPIGQTVYDAFQPEPPGTDPFSVHPADLWRQLRQGILSDDDIAEIKRNPKSPRSVAALAQGAIMLSRGAGEGEHLNWRIVPGEEWSSWNQVQHPEVTQAPGQPADVFRPAVRQAPDGSYYEYQGSHVTSEPVDTKDGRTWVDKHNIIAIPVEGPTGSQGWKDRLFDKFDEMQQKNKGPEPGSPEWFKAKSDAFQKKNFPGAQDLGATGSNPVQKWDELSPELQKWFKDQYGHDSDASAEKHWNDTLPDTAKENKSQMSLEDQVDAWKHFVFEEKGSPENMPPEVKKAIMDQADTPEDFAKFYHALHPETGPESPNEKPDLGLKPKSPESDFENLAQTRMRGASPLEDIPYDESPYPWSQSVKVSWPDGSVHYDQIKGMDAGHAVEMAKRNWPGATIEPIDKIPEGMQPGEEGPNLLTPGEQVGPVDWNWYKPQGGSNPPFEPPFQDSSFQVPHGWDIAPEDMGPRSSDFWDRFGWKPPADSPGISDQEINDLLKPPPDPNSPDFPGFNRWDYQPPPN